MAVRKKYRANYRSNKSGIRKSLATKKKINIKIPSLFKGKSRIYKKKQGLKWVFVNFFAWISYLIFRERKSKKGQKKGSFFKKAL